ncbi:MAG TPA: hypothetical protein PKM88_11115, partial [bacterium]|nr:hypothetical protein [bacterium]
EQNTTVQATVVIKADTGALYALLTDPVAGDRVAGNRTLVKATVHGDTSAGGVRVRFQWRAAAGSWADISPANANHPNPDYSDPYFVHWDVTGLTDGPYYLRAVAEANPAYADTQPAERCITVDRRNPDVFEGIGSDGNQQRKEKVNAADTAAVVTQDADDTGAYEVLLPPGALTGNTAVKLVIYEDTRAGYAGASRREFDTGGTVLEITLDNGQTTLGDTVTITIPYMDNNGDSIIDGTRVRLALATVLYWNGSIWQAVERGNVNIDPARKVFIARVRHFSKFATGKTTLRGDLGAGAGDDVPDGSVNSNDLSVFNGSFGTRRGGDRFRDDADLVITGASEGRVDEEDVFELGRQYGVTQ